MLDQLIKLVDGRLVIPLMFVAVGIPLVRGVFTLSRSRSQNRKEFLELFRRNQDENDFWVTVAVRHVFGAYLPIALIRMLMDGAQPGRALLEVGNSWSFLDVDDASGELRWRRPMFARKDQRRRIVLSLNILYFLAAFASVVLVYLCLAGSFSGLTSAIAWLYVILGLSAAFASLSYADSLRDAGKAAERWLGMP